MDNNLKMPLLMPTPQSINLKEGTFVFERNPKIDIGNIDFLRIGEEIKDEVKKQLFLDMEITITPYKNTAIVLRYNSVMKKEHYQLNITPEKIEIQGGKSGVFLGVQTLKQIISQYGAKIPAMTIEDYPTFEARGLYLDITRGKIPTLDTLKSLVDRISYYKVNQLYLYVEDIFDFSGTSEMWSGRGRITPEELIKLDSYCIEKNIELIPAIATFGHLYMLLSSVSYSHLCELEDTARVKAYWFEKSIHHTFDISNPESIELIKIFIDEYIPLFTSDKIHIGCDETFDLGKGKNLERLKSSSEEELYFEFLNKVLLLVKSHNKTPIVWGDVVQMHYPDSVNRFPKDVIIGNWIYKNEQEKDIALFSEFTQYVCPTTWTFSTFVGSLTNSYNNIKTMARYGQKYKAKGLVVTDWGDKGELCPISFSIPQIIYSACCGWNTEIYTNDNYSYDTFDSTISMIEYGDNSKTLITKIRNTTDSVLRIWSLLLIWLYEHKDYFPEDVKQFCTSRDWFQPMYQETIFDTSEKDLNAIVEKLNETSAHIMEMQKNVYESRRQDLYEMSVAISGASLSYIMLMMVKKYALLQDINLSMTPTELAVAIEYWLEDFSKTWRLRNKESELFRIFDVFNEWCEIFRKWDKN